MMDAGLWAIAAAIFWLRVEECCMRVDDRDCNSTSRFSLALAGLCMGIAVGTTILLLVPR